MHTPLCRHASGEPVDYARRAVELNFTEIGFTDHSPMARDDFDDWRMLSGELDAYVEKVRLAQRTFPQLTIRLAMEVDYLPGHEAWIRDLAARHPWDYFIGSVHYVSDGWAIDNPNKLSEWKKRDSFEVWKIYFDLLTRAAHLCPIGVDQRYVMLLARQALCKRTVRAARRPATPATDDWSCCFRGRRCPGRDYCRD